MSWNFWSKVLQKFYNLPPSLSKRMKPSKCSTGGFSNSMKVPRASQIWKLFIGIFVRWKVLQHSMCRFCNRFFAEFEDSHTLLDVYNISEKLELAHAHYEASTMRPPSRSRPQPSPAAPTKSSHFSSRAIAVHSTAPILPSCNYCGNPTHKTSECNIPSKDLFYDYCEKEGHQEAIYFAKFPERKQL